MLGRASDRKEFLQRQATLGARGFKRGEGFPLLFGLDLGAEENHKGVVWQTLPGTYSPEWLTPAEPTPFTYLPTLSLPWSAVTDFCHLDSQWVAWAGVTFNYMGVEGVVNVPLTGATVGILGAWLIGGNRITRYNELEGAREWTAQGLEQLANPLEYDGTLFFTATQRDSGVPVLGYLEPKLYEDPLNPWRIEYLSMEHLGSAGSVGVHKSQLVLATTKGLWTIRRGDEQSLWVLGDQIDQWLLGPEAQFAITQHHVLALDQGNLWSFQTGEGGEHYPKTRFTRLRTNGHTLVLGSDTEVAFSHGNDFLSFKDYSSRGTALVGAGGALALPTPQPATSPVTLETELALFDSFVGVQGVLVGEGVRGVELDLDSYSVRLRASEHNPRLYRAGYTSRSLRVRIEVEAGTQTTPPLLQLRPRSAT